MKITLVEPAMIKNSRGPSEKPIFCLQPLALGVLAGLTPPGIEVEIIDDRFENIDFSSTRDLVGISVKTFTARRAYQIADEFRCRGTPVILGGHHVSLMTDEAIQHANSVFVGEAETTWATVLDDMRYNRLQRQYIGSRESICPAVPVKRTLFDKKNYLPVVPVETARGCPFNCSFCSVSVFFDRTFRRRNIGQLIDELRALSRKTIMFVDDNIIGEVESAKELFSALIPLKLRWVCQASIAMTRDLELMDLIRKSGCAGVLVGIESLFSDNLKEMHKSWNNSRQDYSESLRVARAYNVAVIGSFIIGLENDTEESLDATLEFTIQQKLFAVLFNMLIPFPQTELYKHFQRDGRLRYATWWLDENYRYGQAVFQPKDFSAQWIEQKRMELYRKFYGAQSIITRLLNHQSNLCDPWHALVYLMINLPGYSQENSRTGKQLGL
jgi:radical SAM superfamily enzyme YgiQ (UPF0313 family)